MSTPYLEGVSGIVAAEPVDAAGRHNDRPADTVAQMAGIARGLANKRLRYQDLTAGGLSMRGSGSSHETTSH